MITRAAVMSDALLEPILASRIWKWLSRPKASRQLSKVQHRRVGGKYTLFGSLSLKEVSAKTIMVYNNQI